MANRTRPGRHNLPAETTRFVGHERDLAELAALLPGERLVTLTGVGGIGKTRLARQLAARVAPGFADGVWLAPLGDVRDPGLIPQAVAAAVGVAEEPGRPLAGTLESALRARDLLLVLDNCEHLIDGAAAFADRLLRACPRLRLLCTSREPLRVPGEVIWRVPPLDVPAATVTDVNGIRGHAAIRLFADRAAAVRPGFGLTTRNAPVVGRLARGLDGLPLALELAAARVAFLTVEQIADRLDERFRLLVQGSRTAAARQRTLRATVDWSHDLLDGDERALLRRLSVFAGGWTLEAAEAICADGPGGMDVLRVLGNLVAKSLVVPEDAGPVDGTPTDGTPADGGSVDGVPRYRLLETIRHYAAERLAIAGEDETVAARHRDHMVGLAERQDWTGWRDPSASWAERLTAFRTVRAELDNFRAALTTSVRRGEPEPGLRLCTALRWFWLIKGSLGEERSWFELCFALPGEAAPAVRAGAHRAFSEVVYEQGELDDAAAHAAKALALYERLGDQRAANGVCGVLGRIDVRRGDQAAAEERLEAVRRRAHEDDPFEEALALSALASLAVRRGRLRGAVRLHEESLTIFRGMDHFGIAANTLAGLGVVAHAQGDPERAMRLYREAHAITNYLDDFRTQRARCLAGMGAAALDLEDLAAARRHLSESLRLSERIGHRLGIARILELFAALELRRGDAQRAVRIAAAAAAFRDAAGVPPTRSSGARREGLLEAIRSRLGGPAVEHLWAQGRAMPAEEAIAYALGADSAPSFPSASSASFPDRPARPAAGGRRGPPGTLTSRERDVARLISAGLTNRGIADELVISPGTAGRHVANILGKLGFTSRAQIAAWWVEHHGGS